MENPLFKRVGIFFVNDFYFNVYETSKNSSRDASVTKQYISNVRIYSTKVKQDKNVYGRLISDIHRFCTKSPKFGNLLFTDFINKFLEPFIPSGYENAFGKKQLDELLCKVITDFLTSYVNYVTNPEILRRIIDKHDIDKEVNCNILFTETQRILEDIQLKIYHEFIGAVNKKDDVINIEAFNEVRERCSQLEVNNNELIENLSNINSEYESLQQKYKKMERLVKLLSKTQITVERKVENPPQSIISVPTPPHPQAQVYEPEPEIQPLTAQNLEKIPSMSETEKVENLPIEVSLPDTSDKLSSKDTLDIFS